MSTTSCDANALVSIVKGVFKAGLEAAMPSEMIRSSISIDWDHVDGPCVELKPGTETSVRFALNSLSKIVVTGTGKAAAQMACTLENQLFDHAPNKESSDLIESLVVGLISTKFQHYFSDLASGQVIPNQQRLRAIQVREAGHPIPTEESISAAADMMQLLIDAILGNCMSQTTSEDNSERKNQGDILVIHLISGGGSALLTAPAASEISLESLQVFNQTVLESGMPIEEINTLRKRLDLFKAGGYLRTCKGLGLLAGRKVHVVSLILSDVIRDNLAVIASGPTYIDHDDSLSALNQVDAAISILNRYHLSEKLPTTLVEILEGKSEYRTSLINPVNVNVEKQAALLSQELRLLSTCDSKIKRSEHIFKIAKIAASFATHSQSSLTNLNLLVGSNSLSLQAALRAAQQLLPPKSYIHSLGSSFCGEIRDASLILKEKTIELAKESVLRQIEQHQALPEKIDILLICGGEITVNLNSSEPDAEAEEVDLSTNEPMLSGPMKGGRCQELALHVLNWLSTLINDRIKVSYELDFKKQCAAHLSVHEATALFCGTDGTDGPTDAAGAIIAYQKGDEDNSTRLQSMQRTLASAISTHRSYEWLKKTLGTTSINPQDLSTGLIVTGSTGTNVMDLYLIAMTLNCLK